MVTAAECVLSLPELVSIILYWVYFSEAKAWYTAKFAFFGLSDDVGRPHTHVWSFDPLPDWVSPSMEQRQLYAGFVKSGTLPKCHSKNVKAHGRLVEGVFFPKLRALRYRLAANAKRIFLADIDAPEVDTLHVHIGGQEHLDVEFSEKVVYRLIKVVKKRYPKLQTIYFEDPRNNINRETMKEVAKSYKVIEWTVSDNGEELETNGL